MSPGRLPVVLASAVALCWLTATTSYGAAAAPAPQPVDLGGQPLPGGTGSTDVADPTELAPGLWADTLGGSLTRNQHHFTYERRIENSTVHVGVVAAPRTPDSDQLHVEAGVLGDDGITGCGTADRSTSYNFPNAVIGAQVAVGGDQPGDTASACASAPVIQLVVSRGSGTNDSEMPIAIKVVEEAPVSGAAELPEPPDDEVGFDAPEPGGEAAELPGAPSFDDAPTIDPGSHGMLMSTSLEEGSEQLWRVPVQWGQRVVVRASLPAADPAIVEQTGCCGVPVAVRLVEPGRSTFGYEAGADDLAADGSYGEEADVLAVGSQPLRYLNRYDDLLPVLPGDHWVSVVVPAPDESAEREPVDVPVELAVAVTGEVEGEPAYREAVLAPGGGAGPKGYSPEEPYLVADGTFSAVASGSPVLPGEDEAWLDGRRWAGLGLGVVSIACLAGGLWRLRARRSA
ncbi:hypothetical protein [Nocardioides sp. SYSU DS0651]|uniref:hypothetical protein n=1 Tax=Nocardioides sp. SYSU DS0651 TaxID=3415955 RepID=UPI003F4BAAAD